MTTSRRDLLKAGAAFGAFNIIPAKVLWGAEAPSNQLTRAVIGCGSISKSGNHLPYKGSRLVGLCDPDLLRVSEGLAFAEGTALTEALALAEGRLIAEAALLAKGLLVAEALLYVFYLKNIRNYIKIKR